MKVEVKHKDTITGQYITEVVPCLEIGEPCNVRGRVSAGNWTVEYIVPWTLGDKKQRCTKYFWRKKEALQWIKDIKLT
jgi:hypothetical protein